MYKNNKNKRKAAFLRRNGDPMPNKGTILLRRVWLWLTAGLTVATGICLMAGCLAIYRSGERPFSLESVAAQFDQIAWLIWLTVGCIAAGFLLELLLPAEKSRVKAIREEADTLAALQVKAGTVTDEALAQQLAAELARFRKADIACIAAMCAVSVRPFLFFLEPLRFTIEELNRDMLQFATRFVISGSIILVLAAVRIYRTKASLNRQIGIYKAALAEKKCDPRKKGHKKSRSICADRRCGCSCAVYRAGCHERGNTGRAGQGHCHLHGMHRIGVTV